MSKRTLTKIIHSFDAVPVVGLKKQFNYVKRDVALPPLPRKQYKIKCERHGSHIVLGSEGQRINPLKVCKNYIQDQRS